MTDPAARVALQRSLYSSRNPTRRYLHSVRRDWVFRYIEERGEQGTVVEIGPGAGVYLSKLAARAQQVIALDIDRAYLRAARADTAVDVAWLQADLRALPLAAQSVDLMLCSEVLEHIEDSAALIQAMASLLRPDGTLILTTPQPFSPLEVLGKIAFLPGVIHVLRWIYQEPIEPTGHINLIGPRDLQAQFARAGLRVERCEYLGMYLPVIAEFGGDWGQRLLARLERTLRATPLRALLWTQCYVLRRVCVSVPKEI